MSVMPAICGRAEAAGVAKGDNAKPAVTKTAKTRLRNRRGSMEPVIPRAVELWKATGFTYSPVPWEHVQVPP